MPPHLSPKHQPKTDMDFENERLDALEKTVRILGESLIRAHQDNSQFLALAAAIADQIADHGQIINALALAVSPNATAELKARVEHSEFQIKGFRKTIKDLRKKLPLLPPLPGETTG